MTFEIDSDRACLLLGIYGFRLFLTMKEILKIQNGDKAVYKYLDFSEGVLKFVVRVSHGANSGKIETGHNNIQGSLIKTINVTGKGYLKMSRPGLAQYPLFLVEEQSGFALLAMQNIFSILTVCTLKNKCWNSLRLTPGQQRYSIFIFLPET